MNGVDSVVIDTKRLWTKMEYSKKVNISRSTLDIWIREKKVKAVRVNGAVLIID
jgi:DNA-binding Xre family transcriptional regulator